MTTKAKLFLALQFCLALAIDAFEGFRLQVSSPLHFAALLFASAVSSALKVKLPGVNGTMSVGFVCVLVGMHAMSCGELIAVGLFGTLAQTYWHAKSRPRWYQVVFNVASNSVAIKVTFLVYHGLTNLNLGLGEPTRLGIAASAYFVLNTLPVATIIGITESRNIVSIWQECYIWCYPYYLAAALIACVYNYVSRIVGWDAVLLVTPVVYLIYRSYRQYLGRLETEKEHAQKLAKLHLRTIEALALAIDAKDRGTHEHLQRVQVYAMDMGAKLNLNSDEIQALLAASLLHDIGKLAVPEHIISKPGRLTPEEFEKMKIHPIVGAEILERVEFPYPVVPIVRSHHEKWDGSGYPYGLKGEEIPIGARILSAVDCFDALASDRPYRRAMPLEDAIAYVVKESGKAFDPAVVKVLSENWRQMEEKSKHGAPSGEYGLTSHDIKVEAGVAPDAGFVGEKSEPVTAESAASKRKSAAFLDSIAAARQEVQSMFELAQELGQSLSLSETLSVLASRLKNLVPYDTMAIYVRKEDRLVPTYVTGYEQRLFASLEIPVGQGLSGWVVDNEKPIVNGNPSVEPGYLNDPNKFSTQQSALAFPLKSSSGVIGTLTLYHSARDAFSMDQLRILQAIGPKLCVSIENAVKYNEARDSATTDYLTGLPNARSLFLHLDAKVSAARQEGSQLAVLVTDLDGFKKVNDRFGHLAGNELLTSFAARLKEIRNDYDYAARMGGDEFVILLENPSPESVCAFVGLLDSLARASSVAVVGEEIVSLSAGTALYPKHGATAEDLLAEADRLMYMNKKQRSASREHASQLANLVQAVKDADAAALQPTAINSSAAEQRI